MKNELSKEDQERIEASNFTGESIFINELVFRLDREVWAHVQNTDPKEDWSTSKAREESKKLIYQYIGEGAKKEGFNEAIEEVNKLIDNKFKYLNHVTDPTKNAQQSALKDIFEELEKLKK